MYLLLVILAVSLAALVVLVARILASRRRVHRINQVLAQYQPLCEAVAALSRDGQGPGSGKRLGEITCISSRPRESQLQGCGEEE
jgi:hypothetical protein